MVSFTGETDETKECLMIGWGILPSLLSRKTITIITRNKSLISTNNYRQLALISKGSHITGEITFLI